MPEAPEIQDIWEMEGGGVVWFCFPQSWSKHTLLVSGLGNSTKTKNCYKEKHINKKCVQE